MAAKLLRSSNSFKTMQQLMRFSSTLSPKISITPDNCPHDELVSIKVTGLESKECYTLASYVTDSKKIPFHAVAHFKSDENGCIDVSKQPSDGGHYRGVFPMGLFNNILPHRANIKHHRFAFKDFEEPLKFNFSVYNGLVGIPISIFGSEEFGLEPICSVNHQRYLLMPGCRRIPVKVGRVRGTLHLPNGEGPFPGVVEMFGSAGGLMEHRAALFASNGIAALALAYFAYDDLPDNYEDLEMSYFQEAVDYLLSRDEVIKSGVGAIGVSKGVDIVLNMGRDIPQVKAIVPINGCVCSLAEETIMKNGVVMPLLPFDFTKSIIQNNGTIDAFNCIPEISDYPESVIPVEDIHADILWIVGQNDENTNSEAHVDHAVERLQKLAPEKMTKLKVLKYPGAGHLLEPAYIPFCSVSYHRASRSGIIWGGVPEDHCKAQEHSWKEILSFFKIKLGSVQSKL